MTSLNFVEAGDSSAPAIVLAHSLGADLSVWDQVVPYLSESWRVIRWDMPGHGDSELSEGPGRMEALCSLLLSGLDDLGVDQFHAAGISLGGMVSLALSQQHPQRVLSLAMLDSGPVLHPSLQWVQRAAQVRSEGMEPLVEPTMERWFTPEFRTGEHAAWYRRTRNSFLECQPEGYAYCCEVIATTDLREGLPGVTGPTLLITGSDDAGATPAQMDVLFEAIPGAVRAPIVLKNARHMTCVEHPLAVADALKRHLQVVS